MKIICPICETEYEEGSVRFCRVCMYSIETDLYLKDLLNRPSEEDLRQYNLSLEEFRGLWRERNAKPQESLISTPKPLLDKGLVEMVEVEGGTFFMGATPEQGNVYDHEKPSHEVRLDSYLIGKFPVTQEEWESVMGSNPSYFKGNKRPVETVSWYEVVEFCNKLSEKEGLQKAYSGSGGNITCDFSSNGYRLPTEAEWEYAARGGKKSKGYRYSGSNNLADVGCYGATNNSGNSSLNEGTSEVGRRKENEIGLYDMSGNVFEWCWDWKGEYSSGIQINPRGANVVSYRVNRGGSWYAVDGCCRVAFRIGHIPDRIDYILGFRLVRTKN